jgi:phage tail-like protein
MAEPVVTGDVDPVAGFKFSVKLGGKTVAWFTECSGLSMERGVYTHEEGGVNTHVHQLPDRCKYTSVTLKRGVAESDADDLLWKWFQEGLYDGKVKRENVSIYLHSTDRKQVMHWDLTRAFPTKWTGPDLKSADNSVAIETLQLVHEGMTVSGWSNSKT